MEKQIILKVRDYKKDKAIACGSWIPFGWKFVAIEILPDKVLNKDILNKLKGEEYIIVLFRRVNRFVIPKAIQ